MSTTDEFIDFILDQLAPVGVIATSRMFGGVLLKVNNKQLGIIINQTLYFKVKEPELRRKFMDVDSEPFTYDRTDRTEPVTVHTWWSVPEEILDDTPALVALAYEVLLQGT